MSEKKYVEIEIDLDEDTIQILDNLCVELNMTRDQVINQAIEQKLRSDAIKQDNAFGEDTH